MRRRDHYWSLFHLPEKRQLNDLRTDHVEAVFEALPQGDQKDWLVWREGFRTWKPFSDFPQLIQSLRQAMRSAPPAESRVPSPPEETAPVEVDTDEEDQNEESVSFAFDPNRARKEPEVDPSAKTVIQPSSQSVAKQAGAKQKTQTGIRQQTPPSQPLPAKSSQKNNEETDRNAETSILSTTAAMSERTAIAHRLSKQDDSDLDLSIVEETGVENRETRFPKKWEVRIHGTTGIQANMTVNVSMHGMQLRDPLPKSLSHYFHVEIKAGKNVIPVVCSALRPAPDGSGRVKIEVNDYPNALQSALIDQMN